MARTRSAQYDDNRRGILARAASVFARLGYDRASIGDLATACGISRGALYHYFASKDAILFAMLEGHVRDLARALEAAVAPIAAPEARLRQAIATSLALYAHSRDEQIVLLNHLGVLAEGEQTQIRALEAGIVSFYAGLLEALNHGGRIDGRTRKVYAMMLLGMINYTYTWYDPHGPVGPAELAGRVADLILAGISSGAAVTPARNRC
jgi:AcrR family transcriptional regulator